jgi:hypothetical protein
MLVQQFTSSTHNIAIYAIDKDWAKLILITNGGTRTPVAILNASCAYTIDEETILFNIGGRGMVAFNPLVALEVLLETTDSP